MGLGISKRASTELYGGHVRRTLRTVGVFAIAAAAAFGGLTAVSPAAHADPLLPGGASMTITAQVNGEVLTIPAGQSADGTPITTSPNAATDNQLWRRGDGQYNGSFDATWYYRLVSVSTGKCLDVDRSTWRLLLKACDSWSETQYWSVGDNSNYGAVRDLIGGYIEALNVGSNGTNLPLGLHWTEADLSEARYRFSADRVKFYVSSAMNGRVVDVANYAVEPGSKVWMWDYNASTNQLWTVGNSRVVGGVTYRQIVGIQSNLCLGVNPSTSTLVIQNCDGSTYQYWNVALGATQANTLLNLNGQAMDLFDWSPYLGATVGVWYAKNDGSSNQQWRAVQAS
jgi:hypothetical protein